MQIVAHAFSAHDLVAGHLALDFVNTVTARDTDTPIDWLDSYDRLLGWAALTDLWEPRLLARLRKQAQPSQQEGAAALNRARRLREALHRVFFALCAGTALPQDALRHVEASWKRALSRTRLARTREGQIECQIDPVASGVDLISDTIALLAIEQMRGLPLGRTRVCAGERCGWLFIDVSKSGRRVWCDMATCGNAAKSRRHYARSRERG